jgi:hypothetical protein
MRLADDVLPVCAFVVALLLRGVFSLSAPIYAEPRYPVMGSAFPFEAPPRSRRRAPTKMYKA